MDYEEEAQQKAYSERAALAGDLRAALLQSRQDISAASGKLARCKAQADAEERQLYYELEVAISNLNELPRQLAEREEPSMLHQQRGATRPQDPWVQEVFHPATGALRPTPACSMQSPRHLTTGFPPSSSSAFLTSPGPIAAGDFHKDLENEISHLQTEVDRRRAQLQVETYRLQAELHQSQGGSPRLGLPHTSSHPSGAAIGIADAAVVGSTVDPCHPDAWKVLGSDAIEAALTSEVSALRAALQYYAERSEARTRARATHEKDEALRAKEQSQREELAALQVLEAQLDLDLDAIAMRASARNPSQQDSDLQLDRLTSSVRKLESACANVTLSLVPLQDTCDRLQVLRKASDILINRFEQRLAVLRPPPPPTVRWLDSESLRGIEALIAILACRCGSPLIAFLTLDVNHSGRVSMCEFDSGLLSGLKRSNFKMRMASDAMMTTTPKRVYLKTNFLDLALQVLRSSDSGVRALTHVA